MTEDPNNIVVVCADCTKERKNKMQEKLKNIDPKTLIGKYVKKGFLGENNKVEHMWVEIIGLSKDGKLIGELNNDPIVITHLQSGDVIELDISEIEQIYGGSKYES